jgi:hypothetical protein
MSFNQGTDMLVEDCVLAEPGRSGLDFEPFAEDWFTQRVTVRNVTFYNCVNYGFAMGNWARNIDYVIDGVDMYETRLGVMYGGFRGGVLTNVRNWSALNYGASYDFNLIGQDMDISNIRTKVAVQTHTITNTFDDGGGTDTYTPSGNLIHSKTITAVAGTGVAWVTGWSDIDGWSFRDFTIAGGLSVAAGVFRYTFPVATTVWGVSLACSTAPTGASILVDVNKNGTTLFTTQGNRPAIVASAFATAAEVTNMEVVNFAAGDYLTVDVDQVGAAVAGSNLVVTVRHG